MAAKKTTRGKKTVARAKASRKSSLRTDRKAPRGGVGKAPTPVEYPDPIV